MKRRVVATLMIVCAALSSCRSVPSEPLNVIVLVIDTLRADRLGAYGNDRGLTPFLDELAARGTVFTNAYATSSWTVPSVASLLTSRFPSQHHVNTFESKLSETEVTFPELLAAAGYRTGGASANIRLHREGGYAQGFEWWQTLQPKAPEAKPRAREVRRAALEWTEHMRTATPERPLMLYLQLMDPHSPYEPPPPYRERFTVPGTTDSAVDSANSKMRTRIGAITAAEIPLLASLYDAEVAAVDADLRLLFEGLERAGALRNAVVVITADHGEEFLEHGLMGHGTSLFEAAVRVPLIVLAPGRAAARVSANVSTVDIAATILDLAGLPPEPRFEGRSLVPYLPPSTPTGGWSGWWSTSPAPSPPPSADVLCELEPVGSSLDARVHRSALIRNREKVVIGKHGWAHLYDLAADPGELHPKSWNRGQRVVLQEALKQRREALARAESRPEVHAIDEATREKLRALGYDF